MLPEEWLGKQITGGVSAIRQQEYSGEEVLDFLLAYRNYIYEVEIQGNMQITEL